MPLVKVIDMSVYLTVANLEAYKSTAWTASSWANAQKQAALDEAEGWAYSEITPKGYGTISTTGGDWYKIRDAILDYALARLTAGGEQSKALRRMANKALLEVKRGRKQTFNRIRDNGRSLFGRGSADGKTDAGTARGAIL